MKRNGIRHKDILERFILLIKKEEYERKIYLHEGEIYGDNNNHVVLD